MFKDAIKQVLTQKYVFIERSYIFNEGVTKLFMWQRLAQMLFSLILGVFLSFHE